VAPLVVVLSVTFTDSIYVPDAGLNTGGAA
jgi:hypothetical protein